MNPIRKSIEITKKRVDYRTTIHSDQLDNIFPGTIMSDPRKIGWI